MHQEENHLSRDRAQIKATQETKLGEPTADKFPQLISIECYH